MEAKVKSISISLAVVLFFVMAVVGYISNQSVAVSSYRAFIGAVITYLLISIAGKVVIRIVVDAMIDDKVNKRVSRTK